jgi:hypothetical protein
MVLDYLRRTTSSDQTTREAALAELRAEAAN